MSEMRFGHLVRGLRESKGFTREDFAREVGTSTSTIARLELADHVPRAEVMVAIARRLGTTVEDLLGADAA